IHVDAVQRADPIRDAADRDDRAAVPASNHQPPERLADVEGGNGGSIVTISGISNRVGTLNRIHVNAAKAGLEGFTRGLAREMAPHAINVNSVAPGMIDTTRGATAGARPGLDERGVPLGRKGTVDEIAGLVRFLASPEGAYTTGQTIHVNGGVYFG
ncbi:MAG: SDR family oxidoreductase, partial [Alphaproteobacteria bacterium]